MLGRRFSPVGIAVVAIRSVRTLLDTVLLGTTLVLLLLLYSLNALVEVVLGRSALGGVSALYIIYLSALVRCKIVVRNRVEHAERRGLNGSFWAISG